MLIASSMTCLFLEKAVRLIIICSSLAYLLNLFFMFQGIKLEKVASIFINSGFKCDCN